MKYLLGLLLSVLILFTFSPAYGILIAPNAITPNYNGTDICDPSYPDFCIDSEPADLSCSNIVEKNFTVIGDDPHDFDRDHDGIGCEQ